MARESYTDKLNLKAILLVVFALASYGCAWLSYFFSHNMIGYGILNFFAVIMTLYGIILSTLGIIDFIKAHKEPYNFRKIISFLLILLYIGFLSFSVYQVIQGELAEKKGIHQISF